MKKIKVLRGISLLFMGVSLCSCGYIDEDQNTEVDTTQQTEKEAKRYTVTYFNYDKTFLYSCEVYEGGTAVYKGPEPTKPSTDDYEYTFAGWNSKENNIKSDVSLTATYKSIYIPSYLVTFLNYDGSTLYQTKVKKGKSATYAGETPTRPDEDRCEYTFIGWDKSLDDIQSTTVVVAQYSVEKFGYSVTFLNYDDTLLDIQYTDYGLGVVYQGNTPERPSDGEISYVFNGWDQPLNSITDDIVVHAQYATTTTKCKVIFKNYDDTTIYETIVNYGQPATCPYTPSRASEGKYSYAFNGWDKDTSTVYRDILVYAQYTQVPRGLSGSFTVTYLDASLEAKITGYSGNEKDVYIPSTILRNDKTYVVKSINDYVFQSKTTIESVYIDENVESVGSYAFYSCSRLENIHLPRSLKTIGSYAFYGTKLKDFEILENVSSIGHRAFPNNPNLIISAGNHYLKFENNILYDYEKTIIYDSYGSKGDLVIANGVKTISADAFYGQSISSVTIPSSVKLIDEYAFCDTNIKYLKINNASCSIKNQAFASCENLTTVDLGNSVVELGYHAFDSASITSVVLPSTLNSLETDAFYNCFQLEQFIGQESGAVMFPVKNGVVYRQSYASIHIVPNAFKGNLYIPQSVSDISVITSYANQVNDIEIDSSNPYFLSYKGGIYNKQTMELIYVMPNVRDLELHEDTLSIGTSVCSNRSDIRSVTFNSKLKVVGESAFYNCYNCTFNDLPSSLQQIRSTAFYQCSVLKTVKIGNNCTSIGASAFRYSGLSSITLGSNVNQISNYAFSQTSITSITLPGSLSVLEGYVFEGCSQLVSVTFGSGISSLPTSLFSGCSNLVSVTLPSTLNIISGYCFSNCASLKTITIPASLLTIASYAFSNSGLTQISLSNTSMTSLNSNAFANCNSLASVTLPSTLKSIGEYCFSNCKSLSSITLPSSVTSVGGSCFYYCSALESVTLPSSLTSLGTYCFYYCSALKSITLPSSLKSIGDYCFYRCTSLTAITLPSSLTSIGSNAFYEAKLQDLTTSSSLSTINSSAFYNSSLQSVTFSSNNLTIQSSAFNNCQSLRDINFGYGNTVCNNSSFNNLTNLNVHAENGNVTFNNYSFRYSSVSNLYIGTNVTLNAYSFNAIQNMFLQKGAAPSVNSNFASSVQNLYYFDTDPNDLRVNFPTSVKNKYFYSESQPIDTLNLYWHYDENGQISIWEPYVPETND